MVDKVEDDVLGDPVGLGQVGVDVRLRVEVGLAVAAGEACQLRLRCYRASASLAPGLDQVGVQGEYVTVESGRRGEGEAAPRNGIY